MVFRSVRNYGSANMPAAMPDRARTFWPVRAQRQRCPFTSGSPAVRWLQLLPGRFVCLPTTRAAENGARYLPEPDGLPKPKAEDGRTPGGLQSLGRDRGRSRGRRHRMGSHLRGGQRGTKALTSPLVGPENRHLPSVKPTGPELEPGLEKWRNRRSERSARSC